MVGTVNAPTSICRSLPHYVLRVTQAVFPGSFKDLRGIPLYYFHGYNIKLGLGTRRFQRAGVDGRSIGVPQRAWGRMRRIASGNYSAQARYLLVGWFRIDTSFPTPARRKRRVTQGFSAGAL